MGEGTRQSSPLRVLLCSLILRAYPVTGLNDNLKHRVSRGGNFLIRPPRQRLLILQHFKVDSSNRRARRARGHARSGEDLETSTDDDGDVFDQWQDANSGGLGGAGSVMRQKV